jgi:hypothetical protein
MFALHPAVVMIGLTALGPSFAGAVPKVADRYYMLAFASQDEANTIPRSHTFAVFVKAPGTGPITKNTRIERHGISWMPVHLGLRSLPATPVAGVNLSLENSIAWAKANDARVTMWGPFRIKKELYEMAVRQEERLNKTITGHVVLDYRYRTNGALNCIHAVSDLDTMQPPADTGAARGNGATEMVVAHFRPYIVPSAEPTQGLLDCLGLKPSSVRFAAVGSASVRK